MALHTTTLVLPGFKKIQTVATLDVGGSLIKVAYFANKTSAASAAEAAFAGERTDVLANPPPNRKSAIIKPGAVSKLRFAYEKKADETIKQHQASKGKVTYTVRLATLEMGRMKEVADMIAESCDLSPASDGQHVIHVTGVGTLKAWQFLEQKLNVKLRMHDEMSVSIRGFKHLLLHLGPDDFLEPYADDSMAQALQTKNFIKSAMATLGGTGPPKVDPNAPVKKQLEEAYDVDFAVPRHVSKFLLLSLGSGAAAIKADGETISPMVDVIQGVGKTFLALGKLLTGKQSYEEIMALALRGNSQNVNTVMGDMQHPIPDGEPPNLYNALPADAVSYFLGKITDPSKKREDFKTEDVMAGVLEMVCAGVVQRTYSVAVANDVEYVFFTGGFVDNAGVRKVLHRFTLQSMLGNPKVKFHITKYPLYIEAIGGLLTPLEPSTPVAAVAAKKGPALKQVKEEVHKDVKPQDKQPNGVQSGAPPAQGSSQDVKPPAGGQTNDAQPQDGQQPGDFGKQQGDVEQKHPTYEQPQDKPPAQDPNAPSPAQDEDKDAKPQADSPQP